jgi:hypothetical protein
MAVGRLEGHLQGFFKGWVYQSQSSSNRLRQPPPPPIRDEVHTLGNGLG